MLSVAPGNVVGSKISSGVVVCFFERAVGRKGGSRVGFKHLADSCSGTVFVHLSLFTSHGNRVMYPSATVESILHNEHTAVVPTGHNDREHGVKGSAPFAKGDLAGAIGTSEVENSGRI